MKNIITVLALFCLSHSFSYAIQTDSLFSLINSYRQQNHLSDLASSSVLDIVATSRAIDLDKTKNFSHYPQKTFTCQQYAESLKLKYRSLGENLSRGYQTPESVLAAWIKSPSHKRLLLNPKYTHLAVAATGDSPYVVAIFSAIPE